MMIANALSPTEIANRLLENIVNPLIALMAFIALLVLVIMGIKYVVNVDDAGNRGDLFKKMGWAVFGIFIIFSIYTVIAFVDRFAEGSVDINPRNIEFGEFDVLERVPN